jgi:hypothetical protein
MLASIKRIEHLGFPEFYYNSTKHSVAKMFMFELVLGKEAKKPVNLAIPMGRRDHSKWVVKMVKRWEEKYTRTNKLLE